MPAFQSTRLSAEELLHKLAPYYPRWDSPRQSLEQYVERYQDTAEFLALRRLSAHALEHDQKWRTFIREVKATLPGRFIQDAVPPWDTIPSYQVVIGYEYPPGSSGSKYHVFRLSHLAPVYDYFEIDRDARQALVRTSRVPTPEGMPIARLVAEKIAEHFDHRWLEPDIGNTAVPDIQVGTLFPGEATLADALFDESPTW